MRYRSIISALAFLATSAFAQVTVQNPWVRATLPGQEVAGAYMTLVSASDTRLVSVSSPVAATTELHQMTMEGDVMRMHPVSGIDLPAGRKIELKPGGYHLMLIDIKRQLKVGETVPIALVIEDRSGKRTRLDVKAPVRPVNTSTDDDR